MTDLWPPPPAPYLPADHLLKVELSSSAPQAVFTGFTGVNPLTDSWYYIYIYINGNALLTLMDGTTADTSYENIPLEVDRGVTPQVFLIRPGKGFRIARVGASGSAASTARVLFYKASGSPPPV